MGKRIIIPWSGGLDSTYLVYTNLRDGNTVLPVYITIENNTSKVDREKKTVAQLVELFKEMDLLGELEDIDFSTEFETGFSPNLAFAQMPIWIIGLLYTNWSECDEIQMGYVMNDDAVSYIDEVKKIWKSYSGITNDGKVPTLKFPLSKMKKWKIWGDLPDKIRQLTMFCETSVGGLDCGECDSCKRYKYDGLFEGYDRNQPVLIPTTSQLSLDFGVDEEFEADEAIGDSVDLEAKASVEA